MQVALTDVVPSAVAALDASRAVAEIAEIGLSLVRDLAAASDFQVMCAEVGTMWPCNQCTVSGSSLWLCGVGRVELVVWSVHYGSLSHL